MIWSHNYLCDLIYYVLKLQMKKGVVKQANISPQQSAHTYHVLVSF